MSWEGVVCDAELSIQSLEVSGYAQGQAHGTVYSQLRHCVRLGNFTSLSVPHLAYRHDSLYLEAVL